MLSLGLGLGMIDQAVPSHDSTRVFVEEGEYEYPTVVQLEELVHEMPLRIESLAPVTFGLGTVDQVVPFHDSMKVESEPPTYPTAVQLFALGHETPWRNIPSERFCVTDQAVPFQDSARSGYPTAVQLVTLGQETPRRELTP